MADEKQSTGTQFDKPKEPYTHVGRPLEPVVKYLESYRREVQKLKDEGAGVEEIVSLSETNFQNLLKYIQAQNETIRRKGRHVWYAVSAGLVALAVAGGLGLYNHNRHIDEWNVLVREKYNPLVKRVEGLQEKLNTDTNVAKIKELEGEAKAMEEIVKGYKPLLEKAKEIIESAQKAGQQ